MIALLVALAGCAPVPLVRGAAPVPKGMVQAEASAQVPMPIPGFEARIGVTDDADVGVSWLPFVGVAGEVRYRFWHADRLDLAYAPGLSIVADVVSPALYDTEVRAPLVLEWHATRALSLSTEARLTFGQRWYRDAGPPVVRGVITRLEPSLGGRFEWHPRRFSLGLSGLVGWDAVRGGLPLTGGVGLDVGFLVGRWPEGRRPPRRGSATGAG